jgi:hypothetical protein
MTETILRVGPTAAHVASRTKQGFSRLTNGCAWNAASAFADCGRAVAHVRGSYGPRSCENSKIRSAARMIS